jgi:hypothetical protein
LARCMSACATPPAASRMRLKQCLAWINRGSVAATRSRRAVEFALLDRVNLVSRILCMGDGRCRAARSGHKPDAIGRDQKPIGEAHSQGQRRHVASETADDKRDKKREETCPRHERRPLQPAGRKERRLVASETSADQGERNRRTENDDKSGYAVQIADEDGRVHWRKDTSDNKSHTDDE